MGFMAGFGPAFAKGIEKNTELREQRKDDAFKLTFAEFSRQREKVSEDKKEDQGFVRKAKAFAAEKDPAVWPVVYNWVKAGLSDEEISKRMQGEFKVGKGTTGATPVAGSSTANASAADTPPEIKQTQSMLSAKAQASPPQSVTTPPEASAAPVEEGAQASPLLLTGQSGKFKNLPTRAQAAPGDQMVKTDGMLDPMTVDPVGTGSTRATPETMARASNTPNKPSGVRNFMRDAFGNGSGPESRREHMDTARTSVADSLGISRQEVDDTFAGYQGNDPDTGGIEWVPATPSPEPDKINTIEEAYLERDAADRAGNPERKAIADQRVRTMIAVEDMKAERKAMENGFRLPGDVYTFFKDGKRIGGGRLVPSQDGAGMVYASGPLAGQPVDPSVQATPKLKEERAAEQAIAGEIQKPLEVVRVKKAALNGLVRNYAGMTDIVNKFGDDVLQPMTTNVAQLGQAVGTEITAAKNLINNTWGGAKKNAAEGKPWYDPNQLSALENQANTLQKMVGVGSYTDQLATARQLFETRQVIAAYQIGGMMGQDGRSLQEAERRVFTEMAGGGRTAGKFKKGMSDFIFEQAANVSAEEKAVYDNSVQLRLFKDPQNWGYTPDAFVAIPVTAELDSNLEAVKDLNNKTGDQTLAKGWMEIKAANGQKTDVVENAANNLGTTTKEQAPPPIQNGPVQLPSDPAEAKKQYDLLDPGTEYIAPDGTKRQKPRPQPVQ